MRHIDALVRLTLAAALLAFATACSVADYKKPVSDFAVGTQHAEESLVELDRLVTDAYAAVHRSRVLSNEALVEIEGTDCQVQSKRCQLVVVDRAGEKELLTPEPALRRMITLMRAIRTYADGLKAIVEADTAEKVATQVNATLGSVESISETMANLDRRVRQPSSFSEYKTSVGQAVNWVIGQYVAKVQVDGLKRATKDAKSVIAAAAGFFKEAAGTASDVPKQVMANEVSKRAAAFENAPSESTLDKLIKSAAKYDQVLLARPPAVFVRLGAAHDALANKLDNDDVSLADAMAKINAFATEAETLAAILKELAAAGKEDAEG